MARRIFSSIITIILIALAPVLSSCGNGNVKPLDPPALEYGEPHPAKMVIALELGWGKGDYQVGYLNDRESKYYKEYENSGAVGPSQFCVDGEGSIYIDDCMNFRILKYDRDGKYVGQVEKELFTSNQATLALGMAAGSDCLYLYDRGRSIIQRYQFQDEEKITLDLSEYGVDPSMQIHDVIYDDAGNAYISDSGSSSSDGSKIIYCKVDPSFSTLVEVREVPGRMLVDYIDQAGDFYSLCYQQDSKQRALCKIDKEGSVSVVKVFPEDIKEALSREEASQDDITFAVGGISFNKEMNIVEIVDVSDNYKDFCKGDNGNLYLSERRNYSANNKSPFRIFKVEIDWSSFN